MPRQDPNMKLVDQKMLRHLENISKETEKFFKEDLVNFFKERPVKKFFEDMVNNPTKKAASGEPIQKQKSREERKAEQKAERDRKDKYNVLGGAYSKLTDTYKIGKVLGEGGFGKVYEVTRKSGDMTVVACKEMDKVNLFRQGMQDMAFTEIKVMKHLAGDPCVMELNDSLEDGSKLYFILDLCKGGDVLGSIAKHFQETGSYTEADAAALMRTMCRAVKYCHDRGVLHRDIKPENFLFTGENSTGTLKLADFGLACFYKHDDPTSPGETDRCGTPPFMAPEMWKGLEYKTEPDVWALGVTLAIMLTGEYPFVFQTADDCARAAVMDHISWDVHPWSLLSGDACNLVAAMLEKDQTKRITLAQALEHPWLREENSTARTTSMSTNLTNGLMKLLNTNQMHRAALKLMAKQAMHSDELDSLIEAFNKTDINGDGQIDEHDLVRVFKNVGTSLTIVEAKKLVDDFSEGKGALNFTDFSAAAMHMRSQADEFRMLDAFDLFDHNKDGVIDYEELVQGLESVGMGMTDEVVGILKDIDQDGDGKISMGEFATFWDLYVRQGDPTLSVIRSGGSGKHATSNRGSELQFLPLDDLVPVGSIGLNFA